MIALATSPLADTSVILDSSNWMLILGSTPLGRAISYVRNASKVDLSRNVRFGWKADICLIARRITGAPTAVDYRLQPAASALETAGV
jgi:hypothetical protein